VDSLIAMLHQISDTEMSDENQSFMVQGVQDAVELTFDSLRNLRPGHWLDIWLIAAALELTDRPSCVKHGLSVPLDEKKRKINHDKEGKVIHEKKGKINHEKEGKVIHEKKGKIKYEEEDEITPIVNPFGRWRKKIDEYRRSSGEGARQVYLCPLNQGMNHFTLLEINE
jgi:hypothetical protein